RSAQSRTKFPLSGVRGFVRDAVPVNNPEPKGFFMSDFDRNYAAARGAGADRALAIDQGLRAYMLRVYNTMAMGVALTGIVAWLTFQAAVVTNAAGNIIGLTAFSHA